MPLVVYFSSVSENTKKFVEKVGVRSMRIPLLPTENFLVVNEPYILLTPSYGAGKPQHAVPKQVIKFLNDAHNRSFLKGLVCSGNTNYGDGYCIAGRIISEKTGAPILYRYELLGLPEDVAAVKEGLEKSWIV